MADGVRLDELVAGMGRRAVPVTPECVLFILLEAVEAMGSAPVRLDPGALSVHPDGSVSVLSSAARCSEAASVESVGEVLSSLLLPPPATVLEFHARVREGSITTHGALASELLSLLVPLNRSAGRRMLSRLVREHQRGAQPVLREPPVDEDAAEGALLAGAEPEVGASGATDTLVDGLTPSPRDATDTEPDARARLAWAEDQEDGPSPGERLRAERLRGSLAVALAVLAVVGAAGYLYLQVRR
ncbi:MAG: hypothetical protein HY909_29930 [Deltaproteobacteria bacterium]|nr:hypothetical protein [Deltaproteobacteria bacterium]